MTGRPPWPAGRPRTIPAPIAARSRSETPWRNRSTRWRHASAPRSAAGAWCVTAKRLGIHSKLHDRPSIALGTAEVNLLELTGAYTPFANGGQGVMPHIIQSVRNGDGKVLYQRQRSTTGQVVALPYVGGDERHAEHDRRCAARENARRSRVRSPPARPARRRTRAMPGSSATPRITSAGVWIGNDDGSRMRKVTGGTLPALLWHDIMTLCA